MLKKIQKYGSKLIIVTGAVSLSIYSFFTILQNNESSIPLYMIVYFASFILFFLSYLAVKRIEANNKILMIIILFGFLFRLVLIPSSPSTSDDVYRYIWEGKMIYHGFNPFELAPNDEILQSLHSEDFPEVVSYPDMTTIYPTFAQIVFTAGYAISGENDVGIKIIYLFAELVTLLFIVRILLFRKLSTNLVILYAWLPLPIMEYFINSHIDAVGIMFFVIFVYYSLVNKYLIASVPFALSVMTKLYPLIFLPLLMRKFGLKKTTILVFIVTIICLALFYPLLPDQRPVNDSLMTYMRNWSFNGSFYTAIFNITGNGYDAKSLVFALMIVSVGNIALRYNDYLKAIYGVWICFVMFSATLYPWYLGWIAAINPMIGLYSVLSLFFTINVTNFTPMADVWTEYWWVLLIQYIPFYVIILYEFKHDIIKYFSKRN